MEKNTGGGLSSGEMQTRNEILKGTYQGDDAQQVLDAINYYEQKYSNKYWVARLPLLFYLFEEG